MTGRIHDRTRPFAETSNSSCTAGAVHTWHSFLVRVGPAEVHVREQCNIPRREVLAGAGEVDPKPNFISLTSGLENKPTKPTFSKSSRRSDCTRSAMAAYSDRLTSSSCCGHTRSQLWFDLARSFAHGGLGAVLPERTRAGAHLGQEVHKRTGEYVFFEPIVHVLAALRAPYETGVLQHRQVL